MPTYIYIAAIVTITVTAKLMHLAFLSGKTLSNATLFGRFVSRIDPARQAFVNGWKTHSWRYLFIAYPSMAISMALVSLVLKWMMPTLDSVQDLGDKARFCLLVFGVGVPASITLAFVLILLVYFLISLWQEWRMPDGDDGAGKKEKSPDATDRA